MSATPTSLQANGLFQFGGKPKRPSAAGQPARRPGPGPRAAPAGTRWGERAGGRRQLARGGLPSARQPGMLRALPHACRLPCRAGASSTAEAKSPRCGHTATNKPTAPPPPVPHPHRPRDPTSPLPLCRPGSAHAPTGAPDWPSPEPAA